VTPGGAGFQPGTDAVSEPFGAGDVAAVCHGAAPGVVGIDDTAGPPAPHPGTAPIAGAGGVGWAVARSPQDTLVVAGAPGPAAAGVGAAATGGTPGTAPAGHAAGVATGATGDGGARIAAAASAVIQGDSGSRPARKS
jgi:hypothetical protein